MQATRPMWTLVGALVLFDERLNGWQWIGVLLAIGSIFVFSFKSKSPMANPQIFKASNQYYVALALAILIGSCAGLYDKYLMRQYDHNAVQVYYTLYQAVMMLVVWGITNKKWPMTNGKNEVNHAPAVEKWQITKKGVILLISLFLIVSDNVYMLALRDPDSLIAVVSTIRRGGAVIGFAYGLLFLKEQDPWKKVACMLGILTGLLFLTIGSIG